MITTQNCWVFKVVIWVPHLFCSVAIFSSIANTSGSLGLYHLLSSLGCVRVEDFGLVPIGFLFEAHAYPFCVGCGDLGVISGAIIITF